MTDSTYDKQLKRAWSGDYSSETGWNAPSVADEKLDPAEARKRCRAQVEAIVPGEAVTISDAGTSGPVEGAMRLAKFVKFREEKFGGVLFETRNEKVYTLNPTGAAVVREIVAGSADVVGSLKGRFDDKDGRIEAEAKAFLDELKTKGLVEA